MKINKYIESENRRWEKCYHEAGHAVVTAHYNAMHCEGDYQDVSKELAIFKEPVNCNDNGRTCGGYYASYFYIDINLPTQDLLDVYLAGFYGERLNPYAQYQYDNLTAQQDDNPNGDVQRVEQLCKQSSADPLAALIGAKARLETLSTLPEISEAIHDVAGVCFARSEKKEIIEGEIIDTVIGNAIYDTVEHDSGGFYERTDYLITVIGLRNFRKLFPELKRRLIEKDRMILAV